MADASRHNSQDINKALASGLDVVLAPGIFQLDNSIRMARPGAVVMGLGSVSYTHLTLPTIYSV